MFRKKPRSVLADILSEKQIHHVICQSIREDVSFKLKGSEVRSAVDGIAGFLGDHMKAVLEVDIEGEIRQVHLFLKRISASNKPKADFINEHNYYRREMLMYRVLEEICEDGSQPWCVKAYIYTDTILVMPDLTHAGYFPCHFLETLDLQHFYLTTSSIARFHAAFVNYETKKSLHLGRPYSTFQEFNHILNEPTFCDSPWLRAAAKLSTNLLKTFSTKFYRNLIGLESKLSELYIQSCDSVREYEDTVNTLVHKDLWVNNIMFKYENCIPINAVLVDFQCLRYGPPAFDLMIFMYLTTDRSFREQYEKSIFDYYYSVFVQHLTNDSKNRLEAVGYDKANFLMWCERARMFGIFSAIGNHPFTLMDPKTAQETFDDPETYEKHTRFDRSEPVIAYAKKCEPYKVRNLEITGEFVERYVLN